MSSKKELIDAYDEWLSKRRWQWFGTLTFRQPTITPARADSLFEGWIDEIQEQVGSRDFHWFRATERGASGDHLHFHILVGGLCDASKWHWLLLWNEIAGDCVISYYNPFQGAIRYLLKEVHPDQGLAIDFDFDLDLPLPAPKRSRT